MALPKYLLIKSCVTLITFVAISGHATQMIDNDDWNSDSDNRNRLAAAAAAAPEPPVYVIKDEPQVSSATSEYSWNNQNLAARRPSDASETNGDSWTDQVGPYYHSYKFLGYNNAASFSNSMQQQATRVEGETHYQAPSNQYTRRAGTKGRGTSTRRSGSKRPQESVDRRKFVPSETQAPSATNTTRRNLPRNNGVGARKNLVCYYGTWAVYRPDAGKFPVENIDPFLCTHVIYGFTGLSFDNMIKPLDPWNDLEDNYGKGAMKRFTNLKRINPDLKTLVAIGGWNEGSIKYSRMAADPEARAKFTSSVVEFIKRYNFDGLDLDWEYPGSRGGSSQDKQNFVKLLRELREAFAPHDYLLTAAVSAGKWFMDPAYDVAQVNRYLDLINLMAYDYHGGWETKTGMNAPLFGSRKHDQTREDMMLNVNWSVNYWLAQGASREKIMLGVGSYGRSFTLDKESVNGINAPASQKGQAGPYTREPGSLGYNEICEAFQRDPRAWTIVRDPDYLAPYAYNGRQWVGYDDQQSLALKTQYAKSMGLGGMMMWSIETDDFQGRCHGEKYPLLNTIKRVLAGTAVAPLPPPAPPSTTSTTSTSTTTTLRPTSGRPVTPSKPPGHEVEEDARPSSTTRRPIKTTTARVTTSSTTFRPQPPIQPEVPSRPPRPVTSRPVASTTRRPQVQPQPASNGEFTCRAEGMFADPANCRRFIRCVSLGLPDRYTLYRFDCAPGTAFNAEQLLCDHLYNVPTCTNQKRNKHQNHHQHQQLITRHHESANTNQVGYSYPTMMLAPSRHHY